jgi:hypothetical protein
MGQSNHFLQVSYGSFTLSVDKIKKNFSLKKNVVHSPKCSTGKDFKARALEH